MLKRSLVLRVLAVSFLLIALPLMIYSFLFFKKTYNDSIDYALDTLKEAALYRTLALEEAAPLGSTFLNELEYILNLDQEISNLPDPEFSNKLVNLTKVLEENLDVFVLTGWLNGKYRILASNRLEDVDKNFLSSTRLPIIKGKGKGSFIRFIYNRELNKTIPYLYSGVSIQPPGAKEPAGYLLVRRNIEKAVKLVLQKIDEEQQKISFAIVSHLGYVEAATDPNLVGQFFTDIPKQRQFQILVQTNRLTFDFFAEKPLSITKKDPNSQFFEFNWGGEIQLASLTPFPEIGNSVLAYSPKSQVFGKALEHFLIIYVTFAVIVIIGGAITFWLARWMAGPLNQIVLLMKNVREGKYNFRFKPEPLGFEINYLGNMLNQTLDSLLENMQKAEDERVKKETAKKEIDIGKQVQQGLLPKKFPETPGVELNVTYFSTVEVGGDFYDFFVIDDNLFLIVGDSAGLGISSCLYALNVRSLIHAYAALYTNVEDIMARVNDAFCEDTGDTGMFVTAVLGVVNLKTHSLSYYSAGHVPGLIRKKSGEVVTLEQRGMALGLTPSSNYRSLKVDLEKGDILIFYTDALIEAVNEKHQYFTLKRIKETLQKRRWNTPKEIVEGLEKEIVNYMGGVPQEEEIVILAVKIKED